MTVPRISIIVPTKDNHKCVSRLYESLRYQTVSSWHLLFVDGSHSHESERQIKMLCAQDKRCTYLKEDTRHSGIYNAMNLGVQYLCRSNTRPDWILFWGGDDYAYSNDIISQIQNNIRNITNVNQFDFLIAGGIYVLPESSDSIRSAKFLSNKHGRRSNFRNLLFRGFIPPHQATLFSIKCFKKETDVYDTSYILAADLDYFLRKSKLGAKFTIIDTEIVIMSAGGVSGRKHYLRSREVVKAYMREFPVSWPIPLLFRYIRRLLTLL